MSSNPYCRTCHKAGKSFTEYTNHWTRDKPGPDGIIVCPTVLNSVCGYCKQKGHWTKYCKGIVKQYKQPDESIIPTTSRMWANIVKKVTSPTKTISPTTDPYQLYMDTDVDVTIDASYICSRPPSPDYPPPPHDYRPPSPDYPPPDSYT